MTQNKSLCLKKILLWSLQLFAGALLAQSPSLINYQGAARLADGTPLGNRTISIKFDLHQGSASGSVVASEVQTLQTNLLGLFTTQVGKNTSLAGINWQGNTMFLQVSLDTSAGSNFTSLGAQQLVSVPYAMHAFSVPASYANNILTIGSTTIALSPTLAVTPNTSITLSGLGSVTSSGTNTFDINIPAPSFTNAGPTTITGSYPNYTVNSSTGVTYTNGTGIAITSGTIINTSPNITPSIAVTNTVAAASSVAGSGSSFSINVPPPTFTNAGPATITGAYPNYTINSPAATSYSAGTGIAITSGTIINTAPHVIPTVAITTTAAAGASVTSAGNSFSINVPAPTFTNTGQQIITGTYPNFSVNTPTVPGTVTPSIAVTTTAAAGASVTSSGSSFSINVPPPAFNNAGQQIITGTYPNFTVNTPTVASGITYTNGTSISITSGSVINNTAPDVTVAFANSGQNIVTGTYPNFTVNTPTVSVSAGTGISVASGSVITNTAPDVIVTFTNSGQNIVTGTYPNFTVNTPTVAATAITGSGLVSAIGGPNYTLNVQSPVFTNTDQNIISGTYPNYSVNTPTVAGTSIALTATAAAGPSVSTIGTNSFNINIPPGIAGWSLLGNAGTNTVTNFIGTTDNVALMFRVNNQRSGQIDPIRLNAYFGGLSGLSNTTGSLNAGFGQSALNANTAGMMNTAMGYRSLASNSTGDGNAAFGSDALLQNTSGIFNAALGLNAGRGNTTGTGNAAVGKDALHDNSTGSNNVAVGFQSGFSALGSGNVFIGASAGFNETGSNKFYLANSGTATTPLMYGDFTTNSIGIGTVTPYGNLHVYSSGAAVMTRISSAAALTGLVQYADGSSSALLNYENTPLYFGTNGANRMVISNTGAVGIGNSSPTATLHVTGTMRLVDGNQGAGKIMTSDASGNASWQASASAGWGLTGNAGTSAGTNFIGTTDAQDLAFKTNGTEIFRTQTTGGLRFSTGINHTISIQTAALNTSGNHLTIKAADAGGSGSAQLGGDLILQGGDQYNGTFAPYTAGNVILRSGRNLLGVSASIKEGGAIVFQSVDPTNTYFEAGRFDIDGNFLITGTATKPGGGSWTAASDARLKTNVHAYDGGLNEILKIQPVWFTYNGEGGMPKETHVGVIAQELQKVSPYMVKEWTYRKSPQDAGTNYLNVDNSAMTYMIINAIKEQQKQIEDLKKITEEQRKLIDELLKK